MYNGNKMFAGAYAIIYLVIFLYLITNQRATRIILPVWSAASGWNDVKLDFIIIVSMRSSLSL